MSEKSTDFTATVLTFATVATDDVVALLNDLIVLDNVTEPTAVKVAVEDDVAEDVLILYLLISILDVELDAKLEADTVIVLICKNYSCKYCCY